MLACKFNLPPLYTVHRTTRLSWIIYFLWFVLLFTHIHFSDTRAFLGVDTLHSIHASDPWALIIGHYSKNSDSGAWSSHGFLVDFVVDLISLHGQAKPK